MDTGLLDRIGLRRTSRIDVGKGARSRTTCRSTALLLGLGTPQQLGGVDHCKTDSSTGDSVWWMVLRPRQRVAENMVK